MYVLGLFLGLWKMGTFWTPAVFCMCPYRREIERVRGRDVALELQWE